MFDDLRKVLLPDRREGADIRLDPVGNIKGVGDRVNPAGEPGLGVVGNPPGAGAFVLPDMRRKISLAFMRE